MKEKHDWGWPVAGYLFLGGLGGGMIIVSSAADLLGGQGGLFAASGLSTRIATQSLLAGVWPWQGYVESISQVHSFLHLLDAGLMIDEAFLQAGLQK